MTEEDVKNKIVNPYLNRLGVDVSEIYFEKSFNITLGKCTYKTNTSEQIEISSPRLDILIKRNGRNFCIFEIKRDNLTITDSDIDQAVSYARLLDDIAPFCVVTNGQDYKFIDTDLAPDICANDCVV